MVHPTMRSPRYRNLHPLRLARTARSMSSTVVLSFHPPASFKADMRHTPAVPVEKISRMVRPCEKGKGMEKRKGTASPPQEKPPEERERERVFTVEAEEGVGGGADFLLHCEVVVQGHLLHPRHQALVRVHWSPPQGQTTIGISDMTIDYFQIYSSSSWASWAHGHHQNNDGKSDSKIVPV